jgi:hypothetical protein
MKAAIRAKPAIKLLPSLFEDRSCAFFEELAGGMGVAAVDSMGLRRMRTPLSEGELYVLSHVNKLGTADVEAWIQEWDREGFLHPQKPSKL